MCLTGAVVACSSLTQEIASLSSFTVMTNIFVTEFAEFTKKFRKNSNSVARSAVLCVPTGTETLEITKMIS